MPVDAVLITGAWVDEIVGKAGHRGEFVPSLGVEVSVARSAVSGAVADADIRKITRTIFADRDVACSIDHPVVDTVGPANDCLGIQIGHARGSLANTALPHNGERPCG